MQGRKLGNLSYIEIIAAFLMALGLIFTFFYFYLGGFFVGLACGMIFKKELQVYFLRFRNSYFYEGTFKSIMLIATLLFFLIATPTFILGLALGFAIDYFIQRRV